MVAALGLLAGCLEVPPRPLPADDGAADAIGYRRRIVIPPGAVSEPLADFPVLVRLADDRDLEAHASPVGLDLVFRDSGGELLAFERELWDGARGDLLAWVKLPLVADDAATELYLHYGDGSEEDRSDPAAVWSNGFTMVWHLDESLDEIGDSTANAVDAEEVTGQAATVEGAIGGAVELGGSDDHVSFGSAVPPEVDTGDQLTVTAWARYDALTDWSQFVGKAPTGSNSFGWTIGIDAEHDFMVRAMNGDVSSRGDSPPARPAIGTWYHWALRYDGGQASDELRLRGFRDGAEQSLAFAAPVPALFDARGGPLYIGCAPWNPAYCIAGAVDEVHVSAVARPPAWIAAEHANQAAGSSFLAVGPEEPLEDPSP